MRFFPLLAVTGLLLSPTSTLLGFQSNSSQAVLQEEAEDYYKKWLKEDVVYIITDEEVAVFSELTTPEEREQFIEQFWFRRDPDPRTSENEFKEEHYRRIAYANEHYGSGDPGWLTDRGRIYIIHGPPDTMESRPMGGAYVRSMEEGGGTTAVHPYEKWRYRYIEGLGNEIELEFIDVSNSNDYKLAVFDWEKDALMMVPGSGKTLAEETGLSTRADRPALTPAAGGAMYGPQNWYRRFADTPFKRYEQFARVGAVPINKYKDLQELVKVNVQYDVIPFEVTESYFRLNEAQALVPITVMIQNKDISFKPEGDKQVARIAVYGLVTSLTNRIVSEFEDDLVTRYSPEELEEGIQKTSVYQKVLPLDLKGRYKIDLVIKDTSTQRVGVIRKALILPSYKSQELEGSTLVLSDVIQSLEEIPDREEMFVLGDVRILPRVEGKFTREMPLGVYYQVYNATIDQTSLKPELRVTYSLFKDGELLKAATDANGESMQFFSGQRIVLMKHLTLQDLEPGKYQIEVKAEDALSSQSITSAALFEVTE